MFTLDALFVSRQNLPDAPAYDIVESRQRRTHLSGGAQLTDLIESSPAPTSTRNASRLVEADEGSACSRRGFGAGGQGAARPGGLRAAARISSPQGQKPA